jgi:hypothetical protein
MFKEYAENKYSSLSFFGGGAGWFPLQFQLSIVNHNLETLKNPRSKTILKF